MALPYFQLKKAKSGFDPLLHIINDECKIRKKRKSRGEKLVDKRDWKVTWGK
jgi:hypothetical protein